MTDLSSVRTNERGIFMDVLCGAAIPGIFIPNLRGFSFRREENEAVTSSMLLPGLDRKMYFLYHMFTEGKFYQIFSFLFGWGLLCR
ncbi:MAG: hypothetical protein H7258_12840 [Ferruginibacter sp.]|nr:hypothetical protein [Ferruginibacter sp.]